MKCRLCKNTELLSISHWAIDMAIFHCQVCDLIFKDPGFDLNWQEQKQRYDLHENDLSNPGYEIFLMKFLQPILPFLKSSDNILDWGSGPQPALATLLGRKGFNCRSYDPIYAPQLPDRQFEAVVSTEVVEHFQNPLDSFRQMLDFVEPGGILAGMTEFHSRAVDFSNWWYAKDPSHICFYSEKTFAWIAKEFNLGIFRNQAPVFIFTKAVV